MTRGGEFMAKSQHITRRTMLRGLGAAIALPWLEAMIPDAPASAGEGNRPPLRMMFLYHPLGAETTAWKGVTGAGRDMRLTPTLRPLESFKEKLLILDGLNRRAGQQSLELSCTTVGNLMHAMNLSWRGPGVPVGAESRPRDVFARMFG